MIVIISFLAPLNLVFLTTGFFIVIDFIMGITRAFKMGESITSRKMANTLYKLIVYNILILTTYILDVYIMKFNLGLVNLITTYLIFVEFKSIDESSKKMFQISIYDKVVSQLTRKENTDKDEGR
jgi:phage-related holin